MDLDQLKELFMNRKQRRHSKSYYSKKLKSVTFDKFENMTTEMKSKRFAAGKLNKDFIGFYKNSIYSVQIFAKDKFDLLGIRRHDEKPIRNWKSLQRIKVELGYKNNWAIECFPPEDQLVDAANMYWLWVYPDGEAPPVNLKGTKL